MIILDHHMCLSINARKTTAMDNLEKLNCHGDVHACEVDSMKKIRKVFEAKVTIEEKAFLDNLKPALWMQRLERHAPNR